MTTQFWINDPTILLNKEYMFNLFPTTQMCYEEKLNSVSRLIILITILGYILTMSSRVIIVGIITLLGIFVLFKMRKEKLSKEGFKKLDRSTNNKNTINNSVINNSVKYINPSNLDIVLKSEFKEGTKKNPFSNVLLTQINDDPDRKSAPPSFNVDVDKDITKNVKRAVQMMNPEIKNTNKQLYGDLWQEFELDQSNRAFFSTANTRVENDQSAFAQFLYNDLKYSAKESTPEGAIARMKDSYRYTLY